MNIKQAMDRGELTEEEAYFILRFAGHMGYDKAIKRLSNPWKNFRRWFVWFGGWESTELGQWDRGLKAWEFTSQWIRERRRLNSPCPVSLFGHRITFFGWGFQAKCLGGVLGFSSDYAHGWPSKLYWSPTGQPGVEGSRTFWVSRRSRFHAEKATE